MSKVILFRGKSGTGKTTLSNELGKRLRLPVLHKDDIYDSVAAFVQEHESRNKICFDYLYRFLQNIMDSNATVILDFGFNHTDDVLPFKAWIEERGGVLKSLLCTCGDDSIWAKRLSERSANPLPNQLITDLTELKEHYKNMNSQRLDDEFILDTVQDREILVAQIESFVLR